MALRASACAVTEFFPKPWGSASFGHAAGVLFGAAVIVIPVRFTWPPDGRQTVYVGGRPMPVMTGDLWLQRRGLAAKSEGPVAPSKRKTQPKCTDFSREWRGQYIFK